MQKAKIIVPAGFVLLIIAAIYAHEYLKTSPALQVPQQESVQASEGDNPWNMGTEPEDPYKAIEQMHGHVGPWNVLGWRIGQTALKEFNTHWGRHDLDITVHIPMETPYSCMADGLVIGTGNSIGRLNIRLEQVGKMEMIKVEIVKKNGDSGIVYKPKIDYLQKILTAPPADIHKLSHECFEMKDEDLFDEERIK